MRSHNFYPKFQEQRDEMDLRPLQYKKVKGMARYRLEDWKERHYSQKYAAMVSQKREPFFYMSRKRSADAPFLRVIFAVT